MEIEDPQGERDSPEALISHAWETEERSSLRSAFRISLPGTRPPSSPGGQSPPHPQDGGRVGPLVHSWLVGNFEISTPSSSLSLYLAAYRYLSLHTQHIVSAKRPSVSAPRPSNLSTRPSNFGSTKAPPRQHCQSSTAASISGLSLRHSWRYLSIDIYLYHSDLWEENRKNRFSVHVCTRGGTNDNFIQKNFQRTHPF